MSAFCYLAPGPLARTAAAGSGLFDRLVDLLLDQGGYALEQVRREASRGSAGVASLIQSGHLRADDDGALSLTPRAVRASEDRMLRELFVASGASRGGRHDRGTGGGPVPGDDTVLHTPGEPLDHLDLSATLGNAARRGLPLSLREDDIAVRRGASSGRCATALLLDLSGSMARHGKFLAARRAALALRALVRRHHPGDELFVAGFATRAAPLPGDRLLTARPCDVGLFDPRQSSLTVAEDDPDAPAHFTNIQAALRLARRWLRGKGDRLRQIVLVTDGEPTAHLEGGRIVLAYPTTACALRHTLAEAARCAGDGASSSLVGLAGQHDSPGLADFLTRLAKAGRGKATVCPPARLGGVLTDRMTTFRRGILP